MWDSLRFIAALFFIIIATFLCFLLMFILFLFCIDTVGFFFGVIIPIVLFLMVGYLFIDWYENC